MAMTMLNIGILALIAAFQSGAFALKRASKTSTAAALADITMERYRRQLYCAIKFDTAEAATAAGDGTYNGDSAYSAGTPLTPANDPDSTCSSTAVPADSDPIQTLIGPDRHSYRVDTYIFMDAVPSGRAVKRVTVVIRDGTALGGVSLARVASTFDKSTGS